jgi:hypothetical protein
MSQGHGWRGPNANNSTNIKGVPYIFVKSFNSKIQGCIRLFEQLTIGLPKTKKVKMVDQKSADK